MLLQAKSKKIADYYSQQKNANVVHKNGVYLIFMHTKPIKGEYDELKKEFARYHRGITSRVELVHYIDCWQKSTS